MKFSFKKILISTFVILMSSTLCSCFGIFSSKKDTYDGPDQGYIQIVRKQYPEVVDYDYIFTNGGYSSYTLVGQDRDGKPFDNIDQAADWIVGDRNMLSVDSVGTLDAKKNGTTTLTAKYGQYSDTIEVKIATIAKQFTLNDGLDEYRVGSTYDFPIDLTANATVWYTFSEQNIISISPTNPNKFYVNNMGSVDVTAEAYTDWEGHKSTLDFTISCVDENSPRFYVDGRLKTSSTFSCAARKYSLLPLEDIGLTAKAYDGTDITSSITLSSGEYSMSTVGTYNLVLSATDTRYHYTSYFNLTLNVTAYEEQKELSPVDAISSSVVRITSVRADGYVQYENAVSAIIFSVDVTINDKYDASDARIWFDFTFNYRQWGASHVYTVNKTVEDVFIKDGARTVTLSYRHETGAVYDLSSVEVTRDNEYINGYFYTYKVY